MTFSIGGRQGVWGTGIRIVVPGERFIKLSALLRSLRVCLWLSFGGWFETVIKLFGRVCRCGNSAMRQVHNSSQWSGFPWAKWSCCWWQFVLNHTKPWVLYWEILEIGRIATLCQPSNKGHIRERHLSLWNKVVTEEKRCSSDKIRTQDNLAVQVTNHCDRRPRRNYLFCQLYSTGQMFVSLAKHGRSV